MKILLFISLLMLFSCNSQEMKLNRVTRFDSYITQLGASTTFGSGNNLGDDNCRKIAIDKFENVYCAGRTTSSLVKGNAVSANDDAFIAKFNRKGKLLWISQIDDEAIFNFNGGDASADDECHSLIIDKDQNIYCGGSTVSNLGGPGSYHGGAFGDAFYIKMNPEGKILKANQFGTVGNDYCYGIAVDSSDSVYCGGQTNRAIGYLADNVTLDTNPSAVNDIYIAKFMKDGSRAWIRQLGTTFTVGGNNLGDDHCTALALSKDESSVYCAGYTAGNMTSPKLGVFDFIVVKMNASDGLNISARQDGTTLEDQCRAIETDKNGNVYCGGIVAGTFVYATTGLAFDFAVLKMDKDLNVTGRFQYGSDSVDQLRALKVDDAGNMYLAGSTQGDFATTGDGFGDIVMMKAKADGTLIWKKQLGSTNYQVDSCSGLAIDPWFNVYCSGTTEADFGETNASLSYDAYILRVNHDGLIFTD